MQPTSFQWKEGTDGIRKIADIPESMVFFLGEEEGSFRLFPVVPCVMADAVGIGLCIDNCMEGIGYGKKKYRIAIMGASGAGKTVFLSSYFNLVTNLGQGKPISLNTPEASGEVGRIIRTLFKQQVPVKEKAKKDLIAYSVIPLDMDVSFIDVPEGGSKKRRDWQDHKFLPELKSADGVLFFLPADDLMKNPERILRENGTFQEALSFSSRKPFFPVERRPENTGSLPVHQGGHRPRRFRRTAYRENDRSPGQRPAEVFRPVSLSFRQRRRSQGFQGNFHRQMAGPENPSERI